MGERWLRVRIIHRNKKLILLEAEKLTSTCADSSMASFLNHEILEEAAAAVVAAARTA